MQLYYGGHTYRVSDSATTWEGGVYYANKAGGYLAEITSKGENKAVLNYLTKSSKKWDFHYTANDGGNAEYVWIGASDVNKEGKWVWSDGSSLSFSNWGFGGEPDNYKDQDGAAISLENWPAGTGGLGKAGQWNDLDVDNYIRYLIEFDGLIGTAHKDKIKGSKLSEDFFGQAGNDTLYGKGGSDLMNGGRGADKLYGGKGADTFVFEFASDSTVKAKGRDLIQDFKRKQGDKIDVSDIDPFNDSGAFDYIGKAKFSGEAGELHYQKKGGKTLISGDLDGDGKADFSIALAKAMNMKEADFIL